MAEAFICDAIRTPIGRYGGGLANVRADDLGAIPIKALMERHPGVDWAALDDVYSAAPTRRARTTATSRAWRRCWPACRTGAGHHGEPAVRVGLDAVASPRAHPRGRDRLAIAGGVET